ncbi:hypothetical protein N9F73_00175 [bacterium]|nr:hypothetical protein [bacterium]
MKKLLLILALSISSSLAEDATGFGKKCNLVIVMTYEKGATMPSQFKSYKITGPEKLKARLWGAVNFRLAQPAAFSGQRRIYLSNFEDSTVKSLSLMESSAGKIRLYLDGAEQEVSLVKFLQGILPPKGVLPVEIEYAERSVCSFPK